MQEVQIIFVVLTVVKMFILVIFQLERSHAEDRCTHVAVNVHTALKPGRPDRQEVKIFGVDGSSYCEKVTV